MNVDGKRIRIEPASNPSSVLSTFWKKKPSANDHLEFRRACGYRFWAVHGQMIHDKKKRPKLGSLGLELAGCPDKLFTCLVAGLPTWVGQQLFFHSYRRNLAQL